MSPKWLKALRIGYAVLEAMAAANVNIKGVPTSTILTGVNVAITTEQTIHQAIHGAQDAPEQAQ